MSAVTKSPLGINGCNRQKVIIMEWLKDKISDIWWDVKEFTLADIKAWWLVAAIVIWYIVW